MGDLFLKRRENWLVWITWGAVGCLICHYLLSYVSNAWFSLTSPAFLLMVLTAWMNFNKRFDFFAALKIFMVVASISVIPLLAKKVSSWEKVIHIAVDSGALFLCIVLVSVICALLARRPKQYY
ncbi:hypothetical protein L1077_08420 [Pseudoalteromonas luteoviolacea]|uniref:hypothetical protein n=1 Tax=Pseudoalteromonas luteoviolacea TaxID=43657 RepID=UPI001F2CD248|nr:hypothetical protein [Pseudoalteromonas luteoviolacea]MCF6439453.1 hypothetical protein [Pseudoalteromonas luteoviolacea]